MFLLYPFFVLLSIVVTVLAFIFAPLLAKLVDHNGDLPTCLSWFQPSDTKAWGDPMFWDNQGAGLTTEQRSAMWLRRNPGQGLDAWLRADCLIGNKRTVFGNTGIHDGTNAIGGFVYIYSCGYVWIHFIIPLGFDRCSITHFGWRLNDTSENFGQFTFTPLRFSRFIKRKNTRK